MYVYATWKALIIMLSLVIVFCVFVTNVFPDATRICNMSTTGVGFVLAMIIFKFCQRLLSCEKS